MPTEIDNNGFREIKDNPITKVGVFPYLGKDIPGAADPTAIYYVYRPAEELMDPECINSFKLLPWIEDHTVLGTALPNGVPVEQRPISGVIGEDVYFRDGYLRGNLKLFSSLLGAKIDSDEKRELSASYQFRLDATPGEFEGQPYQYIQRRIRGNHLASVTEGRSGPDVCVHDHMDIFTITFDQSELTTMADEDVKPDGEGGGEGSMTLDQLIELVNKIAPQVQALTEAMEALKKPAEAETTDIVTDEEVEVDPTVQAMDAQIKGLAKGMKDIQNAISAIAADSGKAVKTVLKEAADRDALAKQLSVHVGTFDHSEMSLQQVAKYGVDKLALACDSGSEVAYLRGYLSNAGKSTTVTAQDAAHAKSAKSVMDNYINGEAK